MAAIVCLQTMGAAPSKCTSNDRPLVCIAESPEFGLIMGPGKAPGAVWSCRLAARLGGVVLLYCESGSGASLDACDQNQWSDSAGVKPDCVWIDRSRSRRPAELSDRELLFAGLSGFHSGWQSKAPTVVGEGSETL